MFFAFTENLLLLFAEHQELVNFDRKSTATSFQLRPQTSITAEPPRKLSNISALSQRRPTVQFSNLNNTNNSNMGGNFSQLNSPGGLSQSSSSNSSNQFNNNPNNRQTIASAQVIEQLTEMLRKSNARVAQMRTSVRPTSLNLRQNH